MVRDEIRSLNGRVMTDVITRIVTVLEDRSDSAAVQEALVVAAFLFEKARGLPLSGWPDEVIRANPDADEMRLLRCAVVAYAERTGVGSWTLGKCDDPSLKPVLASLVRRHLDGDAGELYQAMIALDNLGERVFSDAAVCSILDEEVTRALARKYLGSLQSKRIK